MLPNNNKIILQNILIQGRINIQAYSSMLRSYLTSFNAQEHYKILPGPNSIPFEADDAQKICVAIANQIIDNKLNVQDINTLIPVIVVLIANASLEYSSGVDLEIIIKNIEYRLNLVITQKLSTEDLIELQELINIMQRDDLYRNFDDVLRPYTPYLLLERQKPFIKSISMFNMYIESWLLSDKSVGRSRVISDQPYIDYRLDDHKKTISDTSTLTEKQYSEFDTLKTVTNAPPSTVSTAPHSDLYASEKTPIESPSSLFEAETTIEDTLNESDYSPDIQAAKEWLQKKDFSNEQLALEANSEMTIDASLKAFALGGLLVLATVGISKLLSKK